MKEKLKEYKAHIIMGAVVAIEIAGTVMIYKKIADIING